MESFKIENLSFTYPDREIKTLEDINLTVNPGEFILLCGRSGCGKTTLLRLLKSSLAPHGKKYGDIYFNGKELDSYDPRYQAAAIGFVMQNCDNQIVTDKVWHELSFGLESLGYKQSEIRTRVSEMASFFGLQSWFYKNVTELSGGQKQLLNLASVMVMQPSVLILDEPTSQLDPIAAGEFLKTLEKINRELGTTVILTEHRLEDAFPMADRVVVMDGGKIIADDTPAKVGGTLKEINHSMYRSLPTPVRVHGSVESSFVCPLTVREGRCWLEEYSKHNTPNPEAIPTDAPVPAENETVIEIVDTWFRYEKEQPDIIKGLSIKVHKGELCCIVGGNGTGKTTALNLVSGLNSPYRGKVLINGQDISKIRGLYTGNLGVLPQNPQSLFVKKTVYLDLLEMLSEKKLSKEDKEDRILNISHLCHIENLLDSHPYDLSGGEQQRTALAKILLTEPRILLLDEPTKGMDAQFKDEFADILSKLRSDGTTVLMVSHDIEFCAEYADRCALMFDGSITSEDTPREFFKGKNFYTTSANRMARTVLPNAVLANDIIKAFGGKTQEKEIPPRSFKRDISKRKELSSEEKPGKLSVFRIVTGALFALLYLLTSLSFHTDTDILGLLHITIPNPAILMLLPLIEAVISCICLFPRKKTGIEVVSLPKHDEKTAKRTLVATLLILVLIPLTIFAGIILFGDRKYYFISLLIILETIIPFCMIFEAKQPKARELIVISVLCAICVTGRMAFAVLPQFKPVIALVIISGICFGGETGFLVGAVTAFISNFYFGQGPWTPWQMFALGIIGFIAGVLFQKGALHKTKASLCIFGFVSTILIYGGIMNPASIIMAQTNITKAMIISSYVAGFPLDIVHALSTAFFLWVMAEAMIEKLERIKVKYGFIG